MDVVVVDSGQVDAATHAELRELWHRAYGNRFSADDVNHAFGGVHVMLRDATGLISHASAIPRDIRFGDQPWRRVGYVEAVAVDPLQQGNGNGRRTMQILRAEIGRRWTVAMLSTGRATTFYESLGWERWRGPSYTQTVAGVMTDNEHGGLMILRLHPIAVPDLSVPVTCKDRPGSV